MIVSSLHQSQWERDTQVSCQNLRIFTPSVYHVEAATKTGFPLGLENLENLEKWEGIFQSGKSQGILNRLEKSGKITQNTGKLREFQTNIIFYFLVIFKLTVYYFVEMHQIFSYKINF